MRTAVMVQYIHSSIYNYCMATLCYKYTMQLLTLKKRTNRCTSTDSC